jgi:hypothetical protein
MELLARRCRGEVAEDDFLGGRHERLLFRSRESSRLATLGVPSTLWVSGKICAVRNMPPVTST